MPIHTHIVQINPYSAMSWERNPGKPEGAIDKARSKID
jgi:hypothetical protein